MLKQAVFLVGGRGTRLGVLTDATPKPLLHVGGRPFVDYLVEKAVRCGFEDVVLLAGYLGNQFKEHYAAHPIPGARIEVVIEPEPRGTGGGLKLAAPHLNDTFLLANGDTLFDFNWLDLAAAALQNDAEATVALRNVASAERYSSVTLAADRITKFGSPPKAGSHCLINGGVYVLRKSILALAREISSIEADIFPPLAAEGRLRGQVHDDYFIDIGVPADLERAQREVPPRARRKAIIFDRDGTLNVDHGYVHDWKGFSWTENAPQAIKLCNDLGYLVCVVTNQAGVARGYYDEQAIHALHERMNQELAYLGAHINVFEYCPHHPEGTVAAYRRNCHRRKPGSGMIEACVSKLGLRPSDCIVVGDRDIDMQAADSAGVTGHLFTGGDLLNFIRHLLNRQPDAL